MNLSEEEVEFGKKARIGCIFIIILIFLSTIIGYKLWGIDTAYIFFIISICIGALYGNYITKKSRDMSQKKPGNLTIIVLNKSILVMLRWS